MGIVYRKTEKGQTEIATRAHRLAPRLRSALILVDGKRSDEELAKLIPAPADGVLASLQADGFIEALAAPATAAPVIPTASPPSVAAVVLTLDETRRRAVRWLSDHLGPYADPLNLRLEKVKTAEELRAALLLAVSFVRQQLGASRTQEFEQHVGLPPSAR
jgi:DNA-binding transcriptional ArsR family regulator